MIVSRSRDQTFLHIILFLRKAIEIEALSYLKRFKIKWLLSYLII